jgi:hypothetical protein
MMSIIVEIETLLTEWLAMMNTKLMVRIFLEGLTTSDFVVADEDVEEERDKRILNAKSSSKRKAKKLSSESEASASNSEEERPRKRSKKVAITSDEDD